MTSVISEIIDCPQCGLPAHKDNYHIIGEEKVSCNWCGYDYLKTISGTESTKGYGSIHYTPNGSNKPKEIVRLKSPSNIIYRHQVIMNIQENYDIDKSGFYIWDDENNKLECLIGEKPKTIGETYQEEKDKADYYRQINFASDYQNNNIEL